MMTELSLNILDVVQNSIRAEASFIEILLDEDPERDLLALSLSDNGHGMSESQLERATDPFYTTRTSRNLGLGLPFLKMAAELSGGGLIIESELNRGTSLRACFTRSSLDLNPIGDINETISTLVHSNPHIDFLYTRRFGKREFSLDTREFRRVLKDIPLNAPEISRFIREYLAEHSQSLFLDN